MMYLDRKHLLILNIIILELHKKTDLKMLSIMHIKYQKLKTKLSLLKNK